MLNNHLAANHLFLFNSWVRNSEKGDSLTFSPVTSVLASISGCQCHECSAHGTGYVMRFPTDVVLQSVGAEKYIPLMRNPIGTAC